MDAPHSAPHWPDGCDTMNDRTRGESLWPVESDIDSNPIGRRLLCDERTDRVPRRRSTANRPTWTHSGPHELLERICEDQVRRWHAGQRVPAGGISCSATRGSTVTSEAAFELIYGEFLLARAAGRPGHARGILLAVPTVRGPACQATGASWSSESGKSGRRRPVARPRRAREPPDASAVSRDSIDRAGIPDPG